MNEDTDQDGRPAPGDARVAPAGDGLPPREEQGPPPATPPCRPVGTCDQLPFRCIATSGTDPEEVRERALDSWWGGHRGALVLLGLDSGPHEVPLPHGYVVVPGLDPAPATRPPAALLAGAAFQRLAEGEEPRDVVVDGPDGHPTRFYVTIRGGCRDLLHEHLWLAPCTQDSRSRRALPDYGGFASAWAALAGAALGRATEWPPPFATLYAVGGLSLAAALTGGSTALQAEFHARGLTGRCAAVARATALPAAVKSAAALLQYGRVRGAVGEVQDLLESALAELDGSVLPPRSDSVGETTPAAFPTATSQVDKEATAMALATTHPEWKDAAFARELGVSPSTVSRWGRFQALREAIKEQARAALPRGTKDRETRSVEAFPDDEE